MTFFGFRYIRLDQFPGTPKPEQFYAVAVHSDMKRTGCLRSSNPMLNQLFSNIIWGQKGNFLDVPTDCPQRDEDVYKRQRRYWISTALCSAIMKSP